MTIRAALIGCGYWGRCLLDVVKSQEKNLGVLLSDVCDRHANNLMDCHSKYPGIQTHSSIDTLYSSSLNAVFICTQLKTHYELVKYWLEKGCHVYVEKPFVSSTQEAEELMYIARNRKLSLVCIHRLIYSRSVQWLRRNFFRNGVYPNTTFSAIWGNWGIHQSCGVHWDLGSHFIALFQYLIGKEVLEVEAYPVYSSHRYGVESIAVTLKYNHNINVNIFASWNMHVKKKNIKAISVGRSIEVDFLSPTPLKIAREANGDSDRPKHNSNNQLLKDYRSHIEFNFDEMQTVEDSIADFVRSIHQAREPISGIEIAAEVVRVLSNIDNRLIKNTTA